MIAPAMTTTSAALTQQKCTSAFSRRIGRPPRREVGDRQVQGPAYATVYATPWAPSSLGVGGPIQSLKWSGFSAEKCTSGTLFFLIAKANSARHPAWGRGRTHLCRAPKGAEAIAELIHDAYRIRTSAAHRLATALASAIESTIDSGFGSC